ncbi:MAG: NADH-quinone oxidoreductase subunit C [gamma proteobacterium symbiont of Phacoides pectinatus]
MNETVKSNSQTRHAELAERLREQFGPQGGGVVFALGEVTLEIPRAHLLETCRTLRDADEYRFDVLIDSCGVDYAAYGQSEWETATASASGFGRGVETPEPQNVEVRFAAVHHLLSVTNNLRLRVRAFCDSEPPIVDSVVGIWPAADWFEREAFDLYGILFDGHPDLRRILTDYGFMGHPFRKDFPLGGYVEMRYDAKQRRVIYEPVELEPRTLVPRVVRQANAGAAPAAEDAADA